MIEEQLFVHDFGSIIAIGIQDDNQTNIERRFYSFGNHGATNGELYWVERSAPPLFAFFWTRKATLIRALKNMALFHLLQKDPLSYKNKSYGLWPEAKILALSVYNGIKIKKFIYVSQKNDDVFTYQSDDKIHWNRSE